MRPRDAARFEEWIDAGRAGTMQYLKRASEEGALLRARVHAPFPWARSAIVCLAVYNAAQPRSIEPAPRDAGWIARYAWSSRVDERGVRRPSDYHKVLLKRLRAMETRLHEELGEFESRGVCRYRAGGGAGNGDGRGLGWTGKNTCLNSSQAGVVWISGRAAHFPRS